MQQMNEQMSEQVSVLVLVLVLQVRKASGGPCRKLQLGSQLRAQFVNSLRLDVQWLEEHNV